ncbi:MAG: DNA-processing protein DprA [Cocleimonas sp.]|nr:DNA-processing protein DprA [Cocleimonas sp.]
MKTTEELESWISLWRVSGVGAKYFQVLLAHFDSPSDVFNATSSSLKQAGISQNLADTILDNKESDSAKPDLEWFNAAENHHIITIDCPEYPTLLKQTDSPPPVLYVHGNLSIINDPQLAIVGSRNPTQSGITSAYDFAKHLGQVGLCITSGLALGIDGSAHQGALDGNAPTIAIIATGIDRVYPAKHRDLAHKIAETGAIISEFPIGTQPRSGNFPRRNRIISGLAHGTLVVEAALKSGSLITARLASEQGREVFAIPGSIHNPLAKGCHQLIRQGAKLVETAQDILEEMSAVIDLSEIDQPTLEQPSNTYSEETNIDSEHQILLDKMGYDPIPIDQLVVTTGLKPESIAAMLLILELQNQVSSNGGGTYTRLGKST